MGIRGTKTWDDVQSWLAAAGTVVAGTYSSAGAWTFGPPSTNNGPNHLVRGGLSIDSVFNASPSLGTASIWGTTTGGALPQYQANGNLVLASRSDGTSRDIYFMGGSTFSTIGIASGSGAWTFGPAVTNNFNGQPHKINGGLYSGNVTSTNESGDLFISVNSYATASAGNVRSDTVTGGSLIRLMNRTTNVSCIEFGSNLPGQGLTTAYTTIGNVSHGGAWTFGSTTLAAGQTHAMYGAMFLDGTTTTTFSGNGNNAVVNDTTYFPFILNRGFPQGGSASPRAHWIGNGTSQYYGIGTDNSNQLVMGQANPGTGIITNYTFQMNNGSGAITLGTSTSSTILTVQNTSTSSIVPTMRIRNNDTSASSDGVYDLEIIKGSTNNGAGVNRFIFFSTGAGNSGYIGSNGLNNANFFPTSDRRLKKDIVDLTGALDLVLAMRPVTYKWKQDDSEAVGFIAQEMIDILPRVVASTDDGEGEDLPEGQEPWAMTEGGFVPYLVKAIQELKQQFDDYVAAHP